MNVGRVRHGKEIPGVTMVGQIGKAGKVMNGKTMNGKTRAGVMNGNVGNMKNGTSGQGNARDPGRRRKSLT